MAGKAHTMQVRPGTPIFNPAYPPQLGVKNVPTNNT